MESNTVKKRKNGIDTKNRVLDVSADLFARKGYDNVPLREIAGASGIKESSLYNHFAGKAAILETLFGLFAEVTFQSRPAETELDAMLEIMQPEEIFKHILFHVGNSISERVKNTVTIIHYEKFRNKHAAEMYQEHLVKEPVLYYERLIEKMIFRKMIKSVDAHMFAEQYNYVSIALTQEYFMAQNGFADVNSVVRCMIETLEFFCGLMKQ